MNEDHLEMNEDKVAPVTEELVVWLESNYPDRIVTAEQSPYEQGIVHGVILLIRTLRNILEDERERNRHEWHI